MMALRRTMLYLPGNNPNMLMRGHLFKPDGVILDLEDSVSLGEKEAARILVRETLKNVDFGECEVTVRINGLDTPFWKRDLEEVIPWGIDGIRVPKVETPQDVKLLDEAISEIENKHNLPEGKVQITCLLETALGIWNAYHIATASKRVTAICPGGEDLRADLKTSRSENSEELVGPRRMVVLAAHAAKVDPLDTVFADITDDEGLRRETQWVKQIGYQGKSVIHPNQIPIIHDVFTPTEKEIAQAQKIVQAAKEAAEKGLGAVSVDGKMVDRPVVKRAEYVLQRAGLLEGGE
ncbi:Citryl-CoA lyase [Thermovirga lienii DSM 17291]|jgi:citrate lyase subunit beta/citryl-CoA lyase|uniref:Citryl-CoA lyase n=2 Tax=Thermovirga TaxID=336260 RepID=G7V7N6_THELD|nr:aldolase/citrate lyase family protein [Thermovirga lienii]AER67290.1 Citryl-CoA lyase [Thermovirga lienii DSM 17291]KUK43152.1 MAG: Citryl-CoA lyase [Thermovirga lienii]MDN5318225.1 citrate lyase subunit beta / citryl-CoA lyase [Thermovirga sp.]MDN5367514.1 citrate lyase subunit beta / citryl-CoA lyase [Thermovirga sp.]